jgi:DNA polymerase-3 subunit delta'
MTEDAAQSALKLIEEPPPGTHLVLVAEEPSSLLPTIVSRCQLVRFRPLRRESIEKLLTTQAGMDAASARLVAALSEGSLGRALALREETSIVRARDAALELLRGGSAPGEIQDKVREWSRSLDPNTARRNIELLLMWCHDVLAARYHLPDDQICNIDRKKEIVAQAATWPVARIRGVIDALEEMLDSIDRNVNPSLALHEMLSRLAANAGEDRRP